MDYTEILNYTCVAIWLSTFLIFNFKIEWFFNKKPRTIILLINGISFDLFSFDVSLTELEKTINWIGKDNILKVSNSVMVGLKNFGLGIGQKYDVESINYGEYLNYVGGTQQTNWTWGYKNSQVSVLPPGFFSISIGVAAILGGEVVISGLSWYYYHNK